MPTLSRLSYRYLCYLWLCCLATISYGNRVEVSGQASVSLQQMHYLANPQLITAKQLSPQQLAQQTWLPVANSGKRFDALRQAHWFKLNIHNPSTQPHSYVLWHTTANTQQFDVYLLRQQQILIAKQLGASRVQQDSSNSLFRNVVVLELPPGDAELYVKYFQEDILLHSITGLHLDNKTRYQQQSQIYHYTPFITLPILLVMALYNLGLLITTAYRPYLWVTGIALAYIMTSMAWGGSGFYYFWQNNYELNRVIANFSLGLSGACVAGFTLSYLQLKRRDIFIYYYCLIIGIGGFIYRAFHNVVIFPHLGFAFPQYLDVVLNLIAPTLLLYALYASLVKRDLDSWRYTVAWLPYSLSVLVQVFYPVFSNDIALVVLTMDGGLVLSLILMSLISGKKLQEGKEAVIKEKDDFLARISHEMRTPLNGIIGSIQLLKSGEKADPELLESLSVSAQYLDDAVYNILDFSEIHHQHAQLNFTNKNFKHFIKELRPAHEKTAHKHNIDFCIAISPLLPVNLSFDYKRLRTVLNNLLDNSVKFTDHGFVTCAITLQKRSGQHCTLRFSVRDTGIGINEEQQHAVFQAFKQSGDFYTREHSGMGLGLALAAQNLSLMESNIELHSQPDKGSHFYFDIDSYISLHSNHEVPSKAEHSKRNFNGLKVLYIEDNKVNQMVTEKMLTRRGFIVDLAENGKVGVDKVNQYQYDLILMDCSMPVMNGFEATRAIRANGHQQLPIVAVTANAMDGDRQRCLDAGMNEYVAKPVKPDVLFKTIGLSLQNSSSL